MLLESNPLIIYHFVKFKKNLIFTLYISRYMIKYFLKVLFTLLFLNLLSRTIFAEVRLLTPANGEVLKDVVVNFAWEEVNSESEYVYQYVLYTGENLTSGAILRILEEREITRGLVNNKIYLWRIRYHPKDSFEDVFEFETEPFILSINKEIPKEMLDEYVKQTEDTKEETEEEDKEDENTREEEEEKEEEKIEETLTSEGKEQSQQETKPVIENIRDEKEEEEKTNNLREKEELANKQTPFQNPPLITPYLKTETTPVQESEFNWNLNSSREILGISQVKSPTKYNGEDIVCKFKYFKRNNSLEKIYCNIPKIQFQEEIKYPFANEYSIFVKGQVTRAFNVQVDEYGCKFNLLKPTSWFGCNKKFLQSNILALKPNMFFYLYKDNRRVTVRSFFLENNIFRIMAGHVRNVENMELVHTYRMVHKEYDFFHEERSTYKVWPVDYEERENRENYRENKNIEGKSFSFPFNKIIGVTQWYGNTAYQTPHSGIDFGAKKENVLAVGDGEVVAKGWDSYYGDCLSGGNYVKVKQSNGMYTVYFHLQDISVNTGDIVKKGQAIAKSGNTGAWNCQPLAYHLHFETRLNASFSSHTNPVRYIDVDWNRVPTLGYANNPGRLTGENPHPGW